MPQVAAGRRWPGNGRSKARVAWSYDLLSETERRALCALSVFLGGWSLEAAEEVCSGDGVESGEVLDLLSHLVDKSLVVVEDDGRGARRYRCLETVRQYGRDRLLESGQAERVETPPSRVLLRPGAARRTRAHGPAPGLLAEAASPRARQPALGAGLVYVASSIGGAARQGLGLRDGAVVVLGEAGVFCRGTPVARPGGGDGSRIVPIATSQSMRCPCEYDVLPGRLRRYRPPMR